MSENNNVERLLAPERAVFLATSDEKGRPNVRAMAVVTHEGLKTLWMMTGKACDKSRELAKNPHCHIYATDLEDMENYLELRLWGTMEMLDDPDSRAFAWRDDYLRYFPGGKDDPGLVVLKFTADSGMVQTQAGKKEIALYTVRGPKL